MNYQNQDNKNFRYDSNKVLKNNSRRILYITVIVAALFVAVVSGTFAYFQASVTDTGNISGNIYNINALSSLVVTKINPATAATNGDNLIPFDTFNSSTLNSSTASADMINVALHNGCVDNDNYTACHVFQIDIPFAAGAPRMPITGTVNITPTNTVNLMYTIVMPRSSTDVTSIQQKNGNNYLLNMTSTYYDGKKPDEQTSILTFTNIDSANNNYIPANTGNTVAHNYYYLIVWLEDTGTNQTSQDSGGSYTGTVTITSGTGQLTATFGA